MLQALLGLALLAGCVAAQQMSPVSEEAAVSHFRAGQQAAAQQDFARAIREFETVLKLDPGLTEARANLALMYYSAGKLDLAIPEFLRVTRAAPQLLPAHLFLGLSYLKQGRAVQALDPLKRALQLDPGNAEAARGLLACYLDLGRFREAAEQLEFFKRQGITEDSLYTIGQAYLEIGRELTARMATRFRSSPWAFRLEGDLASERGDAAAAKDAYAKAQAAGGPESERPSASEPDEVLSAALRTLAATPDPKRLYWAIRACSALGNIYFSKLQDSFPDSARSHELQAQVDRLRQDFAGALKEFETAERKSPEDAELHRYSGEMNLLLEHLEAAQRELEQSAALSSGNAQTEFLLAQVFLKKKDTDQAIVHLKRAAERDPGLLEVHALLGTAYLRVDQPALAVPELEKALSLDYYGNVHFQLYKAYRALGKEEPAAKALARSRELRKRTLESQVAKIMGGNGVALDEAGANESEKPNP